MATVTKQPGVSMPLPKLPTNKSSKTGLGAQLGSAGVAACVADLFTFPLDTLKVRLQLQGEGGMKNQNSGVFRTLFNIGRYEGPRSLYSGIVPGLQRQMAFSAIRIGGYETVREFYQELSGAKTGFQMLGIRIAAGVTTGTLAILCAQPTDVVKVRMQAAGGKGQYKGVLDAYRSIAKQEGFKSGLYRGTGPNIARNCIINVGETVVYDVVKEYLISADLMVDGIHCHLSSAVVAGVTATILANPVDVIKTRYMNSPRGKYTGVLNCVTSTARKEGVKAFYKGFTASCMRLVSWNIVLWLTWEQIKIQMKK